MKMFNEAIICYDEALRIQPNFVEALNNKGVSLFRLKVLNILFQIKNRLISNHN
jgi:tetratricopeptide (TPR) repeat protein